jgi:hypothetical protein
MRTRISGILTPAGGSPSASTRATARSRARVDSARVVAIPIPNVTTLGTTPGRENQVRLIKMLGLAVVSAIAAMSLVGASSAMAGNTQLCKLDVGDAACPAGEAFTSIHTIDPLAKLLAHDNFFGIHREILCQALFSGTVLGLGAPQVIHGSFTYTLPHSSSGECFEDETNEHCEEITDLHGGLLKVLRTASELGTVTGEGFEVLVECAGLHCIYEAEGLVGHGLGPLLVGSGNGQITITEQSVKKVSGFLCPATSKLWTSEEPSNCGAVYLAL